ncbi:MAG: thiamine diphosphokinase [Pseudomonadota bacterium]
MHWLIIADGEKIEQAFLDQLTPNRKILVCDGAYNYITKTNITVDVLLGDFDSIDKKLLAASRQNHCMRVVDAPDQSATDLDKAICYLDQQQADNICIAGALGLRADHHLYNLRILSRHYQPNRQLSINTPQQNLFFVRDSTVKLTGYVGATVSIFGFNDAMLSSKGLNYDVRHYRLDAHQNSVCNALQTNEAIMQINGDALFVLDQRICFEINTE